MEVMNLIVKASNVKTEHSSVNQGTALLLISVVMAIVIVVICLMKLDVHQNIQEVAIAQKHASNATIISVYLTLMCVMDPTTAEVII